MGCLGGAQRQECSTPVVQLFEGDHGDVSNYRGIPGNVIDLRAGRLELAGALSTHRAGGGEQGIAAGECGNNALELAGSFAASSGTGDRSASYHPSPLQYMLLPCTLIQFFPCTTSSGMH